MKSIYFLIRECFLPRYSPVVCCCVHVCGTAIIMIIWFNSFVGQYCIFVYHQDTCTSCVCKQHVRDTIMYSNNVHTSLANYLKTCLSDHFSVKANDFPPLKGLYANLETLNIGQLWISFHVSIS